MLICITINFVTSLLMKVSVSWGGSQQLHTTVYNTHSLSSHTLSSHTLSPLTLSLLSHTLSSHTHSLSPLTHSLLSHTLSPLTHSLLSHTLSLSSHTLSPLTHSLSPLYIRVRKLYYNIIILNLARPKTLSKFVAAGSIILQYNIFVVYMPSLIPGVSFTHENYGINFICILFYIIEVGLKLL